MKNKPHINEVMSDAALLKRYAKQLSKLQEELQVFSINFYDSKLLILCSAFEIEIVSIFNFRE